MKHNFKMKLVALVATLSGSALGNCYAMQSNQSTDGGAFGAVKIVKPNAFYGNQLPPIVSSNEPQTTESTIKNLPPIVSTPVFPNAELDTKKTSSTVPIPKPEFQIPKVENPNADKIETATVESSQPKQSPGNMLSPMASKSQPKLPKITTGKMEFSPAPAMSTASESSAEIVIQAKLDPATSKTESKVEQAAQWQSPGPQSKNLSAGGVPIYKTAPVQIARRRGRLGMNSQGTVVSPSVSVPSIVSKSENQQLAPVISPNSQRISPKQELATPAAISKGPGNFATKNEQAIVPMIPASSGASITTAQPKSPTMTTEPIDAIQKTAAPVKTISSPIVRSSAPIPMFPRQIPATQSTGMQIPDAPIPTVQGTAIDAQSVVSQDPNYFTPQPVESPVISSEDVIIDEVPYSTQYSPNSPAGAAGSYFAIDGVYLDRYDGTIAISNFGGLNNFEDNLAAVRFTFGRRFDAANGREFSYFGTDQLSQSAVHTDALGRITVGFPSTGTFATETTAFRDATEQAQTKSTQFHSFEFNKVDWGWDVIKTFVGIRYIYVEDEYIIASQNLANETGLFELYTKNNLIGLHTGYELYWDVGNRLCWSTIGKFGLYVNPNEVDTRLFNAGAQFLDLTDTNTTVSGTIDLGFQGILKLTERTHLRAGYNAFFLTRVAGASDNIPTTVNPTTGSNTSDTGEMFFQGINIGFEFVR